MASNGTEIAVGEWHPAGSSRSVPSRLIEDGGGLKALDEAGAELAGGALAAVDISARVGAIPRRIEFPDGSLFETTDNDAVDRFLKRKGKTNLVHEWERFHPRLIAVVLATVLSGVAIYRYAVPALVEIAVLVTPPIVPKIMSASTMETMDRTLLDTSALAIERQDKIREGFNAIARLSDRGEGGYTLNFRMGGTIGPNAFALPDGTLIVTDELIELAGDDTEMIVGVLAHEIGHVELEHSLRQIYRAAGVAGLVMMIGGDIGSGAEDILVQGAGLLTLSFSRSAEAAADRHSVELMLKARRDPTAIARFFDLLEKELGDSSDTSILATHPGTPERRKAILDYAGELRAQAQ
ncbi:MULTISPECIES: M48 family metallopeptidase [Ensifer]|uniref:M48 family metalloprotease n=1 Tax=Ensifer canadensis TaxID=555315 RepID=A0AAW4FIF5_9HYPH|nr:MULTISPECIES: M48 family metallopeptidase [Ensifer]MDP9628338.1 Zn-dependent protease with chaperone function [Ensifer adhaerens]KQU71679.1 metalloprotease [Ensifer sp. Root31]KQW62744.1 metalloprotease [Ensifer sp. Root1252]KQW84809.1 metalloprotease [Ensifer sp. Root127]KQY71472.1 metalloprotease [Ensifer sp. Root142]